MNAMNELSGASADNWVAICPLTDIVPDTGVCALLQGRHVAVFRVGDAAPRAEEVGPAVGLQAVVPDRADAIDVGTRAGPDLVAREMGLQVHRQ